MDILRRLFHIARAALYTSGGASVDGDSPGSARFGGRGGRDPFDNAEAPGDHGEGPAAGQAGSSEARDPALAEYYSNLEVPYGSDLKTVRSAWRRMMKRYHPDLHSQDPERRRIANELTARLTEAYRGIEGANGC